MTSRAWTSFLSLLVALASCLACGRPAAPQGPGAAVGIEVLGVELMAGGDLARLDYRVVDYEKAKRALAGNVALLAPGDDRALGVTDVGRLGPLKQRPSRSGMKQFILFTNAGRLLKRGATATLAIDHERIAGIPVS